jgi:hypothetical protein
MNPIEHVWHLLKLELKKYMRTHRGTRLRRAIEAVWYNPDFEERCLRLIDSMPARMLEVVKARGGPTKY